MFYFKCRFRPALCLLTALLLLLLFPTGHPTFVFVCFFFFFSFFFTRPVRPRWEEYRLCWGDSTHSTWGRDHVLLWSQLFWWRQWNVWMLHLWEVRPLSDQTWSLSKSFFFSTDFIHLRDENSELLIFFFFNSSLGMERVTSSTEGNSLKSRKQRTPWAKSTAWESDIFVITERKVTFLQGQ